MKAKECSSLKRGFETDWKTKLAVSFWKNSQERGVVCWFEWNPFLPALMNAHYLHHIYYTHNRYFLVKKARSRLLPDRMDLHKLFLLTVKLSCFLFAQNILFRLLMLLKALEVFVKLFVGKSLAKDLKTPNGGIKTTRSIFNQSFWKFIQSILMHYNDFFLNILGSICSWPDIDDYRLNDPQKAEKVLSAVGNRRIFMALLFLLLLDSFAVRI